MKIQKVFHFVVLLVIALAPFFFPAPAEAGDPDIPYVYLDTPSSFKGWSGKYHYVDVVVIACDGSVSHYTWGSLTPQFPIGGDIVKPIKELTAVFSILGTETIYVCSGECGCSGGGSSKKVSTCGGFYIPKRVPQSPAIPVSFKGPGNITSANITFKDLKYNLSLWLHHYDWGSGTWYGYLNTLSLPLGKHHGRVTTFVDGVRGGGCATGGFKVVDE